MKEKISTAFGNAKIYTANPRKTGSHSAAERVIVVPGYSQSITHNQELVNALAGKGFRAETFSQPRQVGKGSNRELSAIQRQGEILSELVKKTTRRGERIHAVVHSLGAGAVLSAARDNPELFSSITLMQPVGMVGELSVPELTKRTVKKTARNQQSTFRGQSLTLQPDDGYAAHADTESAPRFFRRVFRAQNSSVGVLGAQPHLALKEAAAAGKYDIADDLARVNELGIPVHIVTSNGDELFEQEKIDSKYKEVSGAVASYSTVADQQAGHDTFWMQPERTAEIVKQIIQ